ncbi:DUF4912 domain-containing protein [Methylomicrobium lacus]|uniref:DUF4912 domain-containing protein n=1 Tax=Methylomicrobium lacus TaxID=136992 RepID=UPI0035A83FD8
MTFEDVEPRSPIELTRDEMLAISTEISLKFSPDKAALTAARSWPPASMTSPQQAAALPDETPVGGFSHRELQAIGQDISQRFAPKASNNMPELLLLPVDPHHLYAFWETGANAQKSAPAQQPLTLRIYWRPDAAQEITRSNIWFDIPADNPANRKKVRLPIDDTYYSATLGTLKQDRTLDVLAQSNLIHVPTAPNRNQLALEHPATAAKEPALAVNQLQGILSAAQQEGAHFPEGWAIKLHPSHQATPTRDLAKLYIELMTIFKLNRIDAELIPEHAPSVEPEIASGRASGLGL